MIPSNANERKVTWDFGNLTFKQDFLFASSSSYSLPHRVNASSSMSSCYSLSNWDKAAGFYGNQYIKC